MLEAAHQVSVEVCRRVSPRTSFPHAFAFLDGTPSPKSTNDVQRLIRLMAYDIVSIHGSRGADPAGVYAWSLRAIHHFMGHADPGWEWKWEDYHFRVWACPEEKFSASGVHMQINQEEKIHEMCDWVALFENAKVPEVALLDGNSESVYPDPRQTISAAALMVVDAAQALFSPARVSVWLQNQDKECVMMELWSEKTSKYSYLER